jgi:hypothetical protein
VRPASFNDQFPTAAVSNAAENAAPEMTVTQPIDDNPG